MGWGRTLLLGDIGNRMDIADAELEISRIKRELADAYHLDMTQEERIDQLIQDNAELRLYLASLFRLLIKKGIVDLAEVEQMVNDIDSSDGEMDGGHNGPIL